MVTQNASSTSMIEEMLKEGESITNKSQSLIIETADCSNLSPPIFILCNICYWCATYFDMTRIPIDNKCIRCNTNDNNELTSFTIMANESFTFSCNDKRGVELVFKPRYKDS
jgi:hypothetical protein